MDITEEIRVKSITLHLCDQELSDLVDYMLDHVSVDPLEDGDDVTDQEFNGERLYGELESFLRKSLQGPRPKAHARKKKNKFYKESLTADDEEDDDVI